MSNFNKFKSSTIYGSFQNSDLDAINTSNAGAIFDRNVLIKGTLQSNDCSLNTITLNGNITTNSVTISPTELSYLNDCSSNIQGQINSVRTDLSSNIQDLSNNYVKQNKLNTVSTYNQVNSTIVYGSFLNLDTSVVTPGPWLPYPPNSTAQSYFQGTVKIDDGLICSSGLFETITLSSGDGLIVNNGTGNVIVSPLELSRLDGVVSPIQDQINNIVTYYYTGAQVDTKLTEYLKIVDASNTYVTSTFLTTNYFNKVDISNNYLKIVDASNNYVKNSTLTTTLASYVTSTFLTTNYFNKTDLSNNYLQKTSLLPTLLTSNLQVATLDVKSSIITLYDENGLTNGLISSSALDNYFNIHSFNSASQGIRMNGYAVILASGFRGRQGTSGNNISSNRLNLWYDGTNLQLWVDATNIGNFSICDYRIKENIQPASNVLDRLCSVNMFNYETKDISIFKKKGTQIGFFAHELKDAFPELDNIVEGEKDALTEDGEIQPQTITAELTHLLMKAVQELNTKVIELSNRIVELENKNK